MRSYTLYNAPDDAMGCLAEVKESRDERTFSSNFGLQRSTLLGRSTVVIGDLLRGSDAHEKRCDLDVSIVAVWQDRHDSDGRFVIDETAEQRDVVEGTRGDSVELRTMLVGDVCDSH